MYFAIIAARHVLNAALISCLSVVKFMPKGALIISYLASVLRNIFQIKIAQKPNVGMLKAKWTKTKIKMIFLVLAVCLLPLEHTQAFQGRYQTLKVYFEIRIDERPTIVIEVNQALVVPLARSDDHPPASG